MTDTSRITMTRSAAALAGLALVLGGAGAAYLLRHAIAPPPSAGTRAPLAEEPAKTTGHQTGRHSDAAISLSRDAIARAGIVVSPVSRGPSAGEIRLVGQVAPNAYRQVVVTPLVAGRVTRVFAELGAQVRRGQDLAQIESPALAEAYTQYVSARATLEAHEKELRRTEKLVAIGAASRQEIERLHAEHAGQTAAVRSARSRLEVLGVSSNALDAGSRVDATLIVRAPIDGVVTERNANVGLNVDSGSALFTIVDLSTVWILADAYERDFPRIRAAGNAAVTVPAYPGRSWRARIDYIDPQVSPATRTARLRVEVPNPGGELRLGMFANVIVTSATGAATAAVPRAAIQRVGDRAMVYVADPNDRGRFTERDVRLGDTSGDLVEVLSGVSPGEAVVSEGSFFVRAELERLGRRPSSTAGAARAADEQTGGAAVQTARITVGEQGFEPASVSLRAGTPARLILTRTTDKTCGTEVVFSSLQIRRALPLNEPVAIEFTPSTPGELAFACGMNMIHGVVEVQ